MAMDLPGVKPPRGAFDRLATVASLRCLRAKIQGQCHVERINLRVFGGAQIHLAGPPRWRPRARHRRQRRRRPAPVACAVPSPVKRICRCEWVGNTVTEPRVKF